MIEQKLAPDLEKLKLAPIKIDTSILTPNQIEDNKNHAEVEPKIYYHDIEITIENVKELNIISTSFLPEIKLHFTDPTNIMIEKGFPTDNDIISIFIPSRTNLIKPIRADFKILTFVVDTVITSISSYTITGILNVDYMFINEYKAYEKMTSWNVLKQIAERCGLGFKSNIENTEDSMTWINSGLNVSEIVQDITLHSWNGESSFMWCYIDLHYHLCYIDVERALEDKNINKGVINSTISKLGKNNEDIIEEIILTNDTGASNTNGYFNKSLIINKSTEVSLNEGYICQAYFYDRSGNWEKRAGSFLTFNVDSITTPGSESTSLIMKGRPVGDMDFYKSNIGLDYVGKIDTDNVHTEYAYAKVQNSHNLKNIEKVSQTITLPNHNMNLKRFENVKIIFSNGISTPAVNQFNERLTGMWLIIGMSYNFTQKNKLTQHVTVVKRELNVMDITK